MLDDLVKGRGAVSFFKGISRRLEFMSAGAEIDCGHNHNLSTWRTAKSAWQYCVKLVSAVLGRYSWLRNAATSHRIKVDLWLCPQ